MTQTPGGSTERQGFSDDIEQLVIAVRALIGGHWSLFTAELGAISRDAVGVLLGAIAVITLVTAALLALLITLFMLLGAAFFGSMIWGAAHVTLLLLVVAAAITSAILQITAPRRARSLALAFVGGAIGALLVPPVFNGSVGPAAGASLLFALSFLLVDLLVGLATFDMQRFTDRFRPLATEHELRATLDAVDDLRDEAASAFAEEVGGAVGAADAAIAPARKVVRAAADALRGIADRLRERRGAGGDGEDA
jgi:MFS family permease